MTMLGQIENKLQNTLDILNSETGSKLFHEWHFIWEDNNNKTDYFKCLLIKAKFFHEGEELEVMEWLDCLDGTDTSNSYYSKEKLLNLRIFYYKAFISEFKIAYNLAEGE